jgi:hypothetical protein
VELATVLQSLRNVKVIQLFLVDHCLDHKMCIILSPKSWRTKRSKEITPRELNAQKGADDILDV